MRNITLFNINSIVPFIMSSCICCILAWLLILTFPQPQSVEFTKAILSLFVASAFAMVVWVSDMLLEFIIFIALKIKTKRWVWNTEPLKVSVPGYLMLAIAWMVFYVCSSLIGIRYMSHCQFDLDEFLGLMPLFDVVRIVPVISIIVLLIQISLNYINLDRFN